jgi:4-diphosphocytidyl-2-C-methyl-D-erythritol kinase
VISSAFTLPSFAKINWSLRILGKRPDGYHEVRTVLQTISLHDDIHFAERSDGRIVLVCNEPGIPTDVHNLVVKAAQRLQRRYDVRVGADVRLEKRVPTKAGLGGASSNAAIALLGLAYLWKLSLSAIELMEIAAALGADVPFFLVGGRALGRGTGAQITKLPDAKPKHLLIVTPTATVATGDAYRALQATALTTNDTDSILSISRREAEFNDSDQWSVDDDLHNDFERVIFDIEPEIERAKSALLRCGARSALLAGSGSSVFGIFENSGDEHRAVEKMAGEERRWRLFPCATLSREEYAGALSVFGAPLTLF